MRDTRYELVTCKRCNHKYQRMDYGSMIHIMTCGYPLPETSEPKCQACQWEIVDGLCAPFCQSPVLTESLGLAKVNDAMEYIAKQMPTPSQDHTLVILGQAFDGIKNKMTVLPWGFN